MNSDHIIARKDELPATVDGLRDFILVGREKLKAHQAKVKAILAVEGILPEGLR